MGQTNDSSCSGSASFSQWNIGVSYCNGLNLAGKTWRLPNVNELFSLLHKTKNSSPLIETTYFPNTSTSFYWTSTNHVNILSFGNGSIQGYGKTFNLNVRCVTNL